MLLQCAKSRIYSAIWARCVNGGVVVGTIPSKHTMSRRGQGICIKGGSMCMGGATKGWYMIW